MQTVLSVAFPAWITWRVHNYKPDGGLGSYHVLFKYGNFYTGRFAALLARAHRMHCAQPDPSRTVLGSHEELLLVLLVQITS